MSTFTQILKRTYLEAPEQTAVVVLQNRLPDVALTADNIFVYWNNGSSWNGGGTSASAPSGRVFAR